jgi:hypothetical protein
MVFFRKPDTINTVVNITIFNFYLKIGVQNDTFISKFYI